MNTEENNRILVVDDSPAIHEDFCKILAPKYNQSPSLAKMDLLLNNKNEKSGDILSYQIDSAYQCDEALSYVQNALKANKPYALAFVDVQMPPGEDGIITVDRIWKIDSDIQIVICTAYAKYSWEDIREKLGKSDQLFILKNHSTLLKSNN